MKTVSLVPDETMAKESASGVSSNWTIKVVSAELFMFPCASTSDEVFSDEEVIGGVFWASAFATAGTCGNLGVP